MELLNTIFKKEICRIRISRWWYSTALLSGASWCTASRSASLPVQLQATRLCKRVINIAKKITGSSLPSPGRLLTWAETASAPGNHLFDLMSSGKRYRSLKSTTNRFYYSVFPWSRIKYEVSQTHRMNVLPFYCYLVVFRCHFILDSVSISCSMFITIIKGWIWEYVDFSNLPHVIRIALNYHVVSYDQLTLQFGFMLIFLPYHAFGDVSPSSVPPGELHPPPGPAPAVPSATLQTAWCAWLPLLWISGWVSGPFSSCPP